MAQVRRAAFCASVAAAAAVDDVNGDNISVVNDSDITTMTSANGSTLSSSSSDDSYSVWAPRMREVRQQICSYVFNSSAIVAVVSNYSGMLQWELLAHSTSTVASVVNKFITMSDRRCLQHVDVTQSIARFVCDSRVTEEGIKGTLRRRLSHGYFSFIAKYTSN